MTSASSRVRSSPPSTNVHHGDVRALADLERADLIVEAEHAPSIPVRCETVGGARLDTSVAALLPFAFDAEKLK